MFPGSAVRHQGNDLLFHLQSRFLPLSPDPESTQASHRKSPIPQPLFPEYQKYRGQKSLCASSGNDRSHPRSLQVRMYRWNRPRSLQGAAWKLLLPGSLPAFWHTCAHFPGSSAAAPLLPCGTFPPRSMGHPLRYDQKREESVKPAAAVFHWSQAHCVRPFVLYLQTEPLPSPDGSHLPPESLLRADRQPALYSFLREPHTGPGHALPAVRRRAWQAPWHSPPEYNTYPLHARADARA